MRFEKAEDLLTLALAMQASNEGVSLADIEEMHNVSRRTAMRMRDAVLRVFPQAEESVDENRIKRWNIPSNVANRNLSLTPDELASLDFAAKRFKRDGLKLQAKALRDLCAKIKSIQRPDTARRVETDLEALIEAEGLAARPGPRPKIDPEHLQELRDAIKACRVVELQYRAKGKKNPELKRICPYGFLYGHRHYLVGGGTERGREDSFYLFCLSQIERVTICKNSFGRDPKFCIKEYAERSFGVWMEKPQEVEWKFSPKAAMVAREFVFHPSQKLKDHKDGSLTISFKAGGLLEMAWHLYKWGDQVEVLKPAALKKLVKDSAKKWEGLP